MATPNQALHAQAFERLTTEMRAANDATEWELVTNVRLAFGALRYAEADKDTGDDPEDFLEAAEKALERAIDELDTYRLEKHVEDTLQKFGQMVVIRDEIATIVHTYVQTTQNHMPDYEDDQMSYRLDVITTMRDVIKTLAH